MTPPDTGSGRRWLQLVAGLLISAGMIWFAFRDQSFAEIWQHIVAMRPLSMVVAVALATASFPLRLPRWRLLLRREDGGAVADGPLWHAIAIGFAGNNVLPFRLGEVVRMGTVSRLGGVPFPAALSSVAVERVLDGIVSLALLALGFFVADLPVDGALARQATLIGAVFLLALVVAVVLAWRPAIADALVTRLLPRGKFRDGVAAIVARVLQGLGALRDPRRAGPVLGWTAALWLVNAAAFWFGFRAFGIDVPYAGALIVQGLVMIGIALPAAPGFVGTFEAGIFVPLEAFFGIDHGVALACAITYHVLTFIPITLLGAWSLVSSGLSLRSAREAAA